jgi:hypothetical protein
MKVDRYGIQSRRFGLLIRGKKEIEDEARAREL